MSPSNASKGTYTTFDDITNKTSQEVKSLLQLENEPSHVATFDTLQIMDDINIPKEKWGMSVNLEPITSSFPDLGSGGATQVTTKTNIKDYTLKELNNAGN